MKSLRLFCALCFAFSHAVLFAADAAPALMKDRHDKSDIRISGEVIHEGYLPWRKGLTLDDALKTAGGLNRYARGVYIIPAEKDSPKKTRAILQRDMKSDPKVLEAVLEPGEHVYAWTTI